MARTPSAARHGTLRLAALLCAALAAPPPLTAQQGSGKVTGVVRDAATGQPLAGAQVFVEGLNVGALSAENGRYFLINVPAGTYTITAQLIGYATVRKENVLVAVDVTRSLDFELPSQAVAVQGVVVEAERVPLIETRATGTRDVVTAQEIQALPVTDISGALQLYAGYLEVPQNTDVLSYLDTERGLTPVRIRGGRGGEVITWIDGIPVNNFLLGGPALSLSSLVTEQVDLARGGFEAKYGNALSGVINIKTREPRTYYQSSLQYQTSALGGALGSDYDELRNFHLLEGFVSGPVPGTANKVRFVAAGRSNSGDGRVLRFDNDIWYPIQQLRDERDNYGSIFDLIPGMRAVGYSQTQDALLKLGYYFSPAAKVTATLVDYQQQLQPYSFAWLQVGFDMYGQCAKIYPEWEDVCRRQYLAGADPQKIEHLRFSNQENQYVIRNSIRRNARLYALNWDHTRGRFAYNIGLGRFEQDRDTCAFLAGVCLGPRIAAISSNGAFVSSYFTSRNHGRHPIFGTSDVMGGDRTESWFARADLSWQATDHHDLAFGAFFQQHDIEFFEGRDVGLNQVQIEWNRYAGRPWDAALYLQDRIEYDFVTIRLGVRFDYGRASGLFFADPQDPTNGTTAFHVCENPTAFGLPADRFVYQDPSTGQTHRGITACALNRELMDAAVAKAMEDDFVEAKPRRQFSPRLGISFPVTEGSSLFFNYGRFSQNPLLNNLYRMTGIGTTTPGGEPIEGTRNALGLVVNSIRTPLLGNPHLLAEGTTAYELGYLAEIAAGRYGFGAVVFTKDQFGLTGVRSGGRDESGRIIFDPGSTYGSTTQEYQVLLNLDYQTARGLEVAFRRRMENHWAFDLRYTYSQVRTNAAPPELELQKQEEADRPARKEIASEIDQPHVLTGVLRFQVDGDPPDIPFGALLANTTLSLTTRIASGLPFTPTTSFSGDCTAADCDRLTRNSGRGPTTIDTDLLLRKNFRHRNVRYGAFVRITNLLNRKNCVQVFTTTGRCDGGAIAQARLQVGSASATGTLSQSWDRADFVSPPRSVNFGITIGF